MTVTKMNYNRLSLRKLDLWREHDQYRPPSKRGNEKDEGDSGSANTQRGSRGNYLDGALGSYDGDDPFLLECKRRRSLLEPLNAREAGQAGEMLRFLERERDAVLLLREAENDGSLCERGAELLALANARRTLSYRQVAEVKQLDRSWRQAA